MIIYLGNKLAVHGKNPTSVDVLGRRLSEEFPGLVAVSDKENFFARMLDMWFSLVKHRNEAEFVLIDTYSTMAFHFAWTSALLCRLFGIRYIPIIHGGSFEHRIRVSEKLVRTFLEKSFRVVTPSGFLQEVIQGRLKISATVIPNAVDLKDFPSALRVSFLPTPRIIWLRAYQEIYSPLVAVEILRELQQQHGLNAELVMIGPDKDGSFAKVKAAVEHYGLQDSVSLHLKLPKAEWIQLARTGTVFLNTTTVDNTPVSVIEAMSLGLPVVSSDVGGMPYLVQPEVNGFLFPVGDFKAAAQFIVSLHADADRWARISQNALTESGKMDWDSSVKNQWKALLQAHEKLD